VSKQQKHQQNGGKAMRKNCARMSLLDTYHSVEERLEHDKPELFKLLDEHLDWDVIIPQAFFNAFYKRFGRNREYGLESFLRSLFLQRVFHYLEDSQLLNTLRFSREMRKFCRFSKVPDAAKLTRFKQDFCGHIRSVFERLVELTEPICREMDTALADLLVFDTTGVESYVTENNPKFMAAKLRQAKSIAKANPSFDPEKGVYALLPDCAASNPAIRQQYVNGHFCYAQKAAVISNGLGIVRHLELLDEEFKIAHPEIPVEKRSSSPDRDKEIGDSTALKPVLLDFRAAHPNFHYDTFTGDAAFDSYDNYKFLLKEYGFSRAVVPINPRNSADTNKEFNQNGTPVCPADKTPFLFHSVCGGKNRSRRFKYICPKTKVLRLPSRGVTHRCFCETPCSDSKYGKSVCVYPDKDLRLYPGLARDSQDFSQIYKRRAAVERSINSLKDTLGVAGRKTSNALTTKADLFLAGIVQLLCVLLAHKLHDTKLARRPRKLIA
jgi:hypothetical protein